MATLTPEESSASTDWQTTKGTVRERTAFLFNNSLMSDITFVLTDPDGTQVRVPAHKLVLAISSPVFEAMFYGELAEKRREIELPDTERAYLLEFLRFLYCDEPELTTDNAFGVLYLAQKYIVPPLADKCWAFIDENPCACLESDNAVSSLNQEMLASLAKRDTLQIKKELELFEAMKHWAQKRCKAEGLEPTGESIGRALGNVKDLVRWPTISQQDFALHVQPTGILTGQESLDIFKYYSGAATGRKRKYCEIYRAGAISDAVIHECCREVCVHSVVGPISEQPGEKLHLVVEDRNVHLKGIQLVTDNTCNYLDQTSHRSLDADVRLLDQDGEELAASTGNFLEQKIEVHVQRTTQYATAVGRSGKHYVQRESTEKTTEQQRGILIEFEHPVLIWKAVKHTLIVKVQCTEGGMLNPRLDSRYAESATASNVSFKFEGSCPIYKLLFYKMD